MEFTLAIVPLLMMIFALLDVAWGMYVKTTLMYAVRVGVRQGITITGTDAGGSDLTTMVKATVQKNALGLLSGTNATKIKVHFYRPPDAGSSAAPTDVTGQSNGNAPGNIIEVSIQGYSLGPLVARIFGLHTSVDKASTAIGAVAADVIEPSRDVPSMGSAP